MPITTSARRVKDAGFWCEDADQQTEKMLNAIGADWNTEIPIEAGLDHLGLSNTLLALGAVRPKYEAQAHKVLSEYTLSLLTHIQVAINRLTGSQDMVVRNIAIAFDNPNRIGLLASERARWSKSKYAEADPNLAFMYSALEMLCAPMPLHMRALHASKEALSGVAGAGLPQDYLLKELKTELRKLLNAAA